MPEGPEVRKTVDGLSQAFLNEEIDLFEFMSGRYTKKDPFGYLDMCEELPRLVTAVGCKGKFIYFLFADGSSLWNTLGMSGYWSHTQGRHPRAILSTTAGTTMFYNDMRNFGTFKFVNTQEELDKKLRSLGPDLLTEDVGFDAFSSCLLRGKRGKKTIAENLMNQSVVSGIGNYLKAEILYEAKISPWRTCDSLTDRELRSILESSKKMIRLSYELGGATLRDYRNPNGDKAKFSRRFAVYGWDRDLTGRRVVKEKTPDKRTTHWCPEVQK